MPFCRSFALILALCLSADVLYAQEAETTLYQKVRAAYDATESYHADQTFEISRLAGRLRMIQTFEVAYERSSSRLLVDQPQVLVVHDDGKLFIRPGWAPGQHYEAPISPRLSLSRLMRAAPFLEQPPLPDIAMLLGSEPIDDSNVTELPADDAGRDRLHFDTAQGKITLHIDPKSHLVSEMQWDLPADMLDGADVNEVVSAKLTIDIKQHNKPVKAELFSHEWGTQLAQLPGQEPGPEDRHAQAKSLEGKAAPPVQLRDLDGKIFDLAAQTDKIVILDFWATWCRPCVIGMAELDIVNKWAKEQKHSLRIVGVNIGETKDLVEPFWKKHDYGFTTVFDTHRLVANAYGVSPIPHTVFIHNGNVAVVKIGSGRGASESYKKIITDLLATDEEG